MKTILKDAAEDQVSAFISKFAPTNQKFIKSVRRALQKRLPAANELVYDNYNFFVIGYSSTERTSDAILSLAADANGVALHFYWGATLPDPEKILLGSGVQNRFIRLKPALTLNLPEVETLIADAIAHAKTPLATSGKGRLIVRSVSGKQRPRRKSPK